MAYIRTEKQKKNYKNFMKEISHLLTALDSKFNFDYIGDNTDGGSGYQLHIETKKEDTFYNSFFIFFEDQSGCDLCPEDFELELRDTYELNIQVQINDDEHIDCFTKIDDAIHYYHEKIILEEDSKYYDYYLKF